jgi:hypothetical protein
MKLTKKDINELIRFIENSDNFFIAVADEEQVLLHTAGNLYAVMGSCLENDSEVRNEVQRAINYINLTNGVDKVVKVSNISN